jgi:hypothetical protein
MKELFLPLAIGAGAYFLFKKSVSIPTVNENTNPIVVVPDPVVLVPPSTVVDPVVVVDPIVNPPLLQQQTTGDVVIVDDFQYNSEAEFESVWEVSSPGYLTFTPNGLRGVVDGGLNSAYISKSIPASNYYRCSFDLYHEQGFDWESVGDPAGSCPGGNGSKVCYIKAYPSDAGLISTFLFIEPWSHELRISVAHGGYGQMCPSGPNMPVGAQPNEECMFKTNMGSARIVTGQTQHIVWELEKGTPGQQDGSIRAWIDGEQVIGYDNVVGFVSANELNSYYNYFTYYTQCGYGVRYFNNLVLSK